MQVYRRAPRETAKEFVLAPFSGFFVVWVASLFTKNGWVLSGVFLAVIALYAFLTFFNEDIRFELHQTGTLYYYKRSRLVQSIELRNYAVERRETGGGTLFPAFLLLLCLVEEHSGEKTEIDCTPIGKKRFDDMYREIRSYSKEYVA